MLIVLWYYSLIDKISENIFSWFKLLFLDLSILSKLLYWVIDLLFTAITVYLLNWIFFKNTFYNQLIVSAYVSDIVLINYCYYLFECIVQDIWICDFSKLYCAYFSFDISILIDWICSRTYWSLAVKLWILFFSSLIKNFHSIVNTFHLLRKFLIVQFSPPLELA